MKFRTGTGSTAANLYCQEGETPSKDDKLIAVAISAEEADALSAMVNVAFDAFKGMAEIVAPGSTK